jgi:hypothetical protein
LAQEPGQGELHPVDNAEADNIYDFGKHAIPHSEMLNRLLRNHHPRIQALEKDVEDLKKALSELKAQKPNRGNP